MLRSVTLPQPSSLGMPVAYTGHFVMIVMAGDACDLYASLSHDCDGWGCL